MNEEDFLFGRTTNDLNARKEVKIKLPVGQLVKLHGLKLMRGQTITDTVIEALDRYFEERMLEDGRGRRTHAASEAVGSAGRSG